MSMSTLSNQVSDRQQIGQQRLDCVICNYRIDPDKATLSAFPCNLRAFADQTFHVWRCPTCETIHCLEAVDLDYYYAQYPGEALSLTAPLRLIYQGLQRRLTQHGFSVRHSLLDYGCGEGLFLQYLRSHGFAQCSGYDPYAAPDQYGNKAVLDQGPFDYILLSDVIEHVEDPRALLTTLDALLAPGGRILIGAPNAANLDLSQPNISDYYNEVHVPYHLHTYTRQVIEALALEQGWEPVKFFDRAYYDSPWFGLNARAWNQYQRLCDGTIDAVVSDPIEWGRALTSPRFWFYALFGYWLSFRTGMDILFQKPVAQAVMFAGPAAAGHPLNS
ncbi:MAG: class I SAM-dependent methyltransferase [Cyanobacteria bacterium P01_G01_bin.38]